MKFHNAIYSANAGLMLGHRLRRCPNFNPALSEYIVFAGNADKPTALDNGIVF